MRIVVASGKGGTGKTFLSTNLFRTMELSGLKPVLVDCDAEVPNASIFIGGQALNSWETTMFCPEIDANRCTFCNRCQEFCTFHAITCVPAMKYIKLSADLCHGCEACVHACEQKAILPGQKMIGKVSAIGESHRTRVFEARIKEGEHSGVPVIRDAIRKAMEAKTDHLILDAPPGCSCPFVNTVLDADLVILITEPTPFGLSDLRQTIEVLRDLKQEFCVVINRSDLGDGLMDSYLKEEGIQVLARIPFSRSLANCYAQGKLVVEEDAELAELFNRLMQRVLNYEDSNH